MGKTILLVILFVGIAALMMFPVMNALAASTGTGTVTFINKPGTHGKIVRTDDGSNDQYQFRIPQDLANPNIIPAVGDTVTFDIDPDQAKKARNVVGDTIPPIITGSVSPAPNANGWNASPVTVSFSCVDNVGGSGVASVTGPIVVTTEGAAQAFVGICTDVAGNSANTTVFVSIDQTPPSIFGSIFPTPDANGFNDTDVTVTFNCFDALSGVASVTGPILVTTEGVNQPVAGVCADLAGNEAATIVFVSIDKTPGGDELPPGPGSGGPGL